MSRAVWRRNMRWWLPALALCLLGVALLTTYQLVLAEEARIGVSLLGRRSAELERLQDLRREHVELASRARETEEGIRAFYRDRLASEEEKLTEVIAEIKNLARRANLEPGSIRYERDEITRQNIVERSLVFDVVGTYSELRRLVNFLELSDSFLILEQVSLGITDERGLQLGIELRIAVLFAASASAVEKGDQA